MRVRYLGKSDPLELLNSKVYDVISVEGDWYRIVDETGEDYLYPPQCFEIVEPADSSTVILTYEECVERSKSARAKEDYRKPREILAHAGFETALATPVGTVSLELDGKPAEFELLRRFDRYGFAGCTTFFVGVATSTSKNVQAITCTFEPSGHGSCFAASGECVESVGYDTEGYVLHISASREDPEAYLGSEDYSVTCDGRGLTITVPAKAPAQQLVFGVSWVKKGGIEDGTSAWLSSDPNFAGEYWLELTEEASGHCPECGSQLTGRSKVDCLGSFCTSCDWAVVMQPYRPMEDDYTTYTIELSPGNEVGKPAMSALNKILGCGYAKAKDIILQAPYVLSEGDAAETLRITEILNDSGLEHAVTPKFPHHREPDGSIWSDFQDGDTIGEAGSEGGRIIYDVEYIHGARVTVEETTSIPFSVTCGIYGLIVHTTFAKSEEEALSKAHLIQSELADCLRNPPTDETAWCDSFASRW